MIPERLTRNIGVLLVAAFVLLDIGLVYLALQPRIPQDSSVVTSPAESATPTATEKPTATAAVAPVGRELPLSVSGNTAMRGKAGSCAKGGSKVELTTDGGEEWNSVTSPADLVLRVRVSDSEPFAIAADADGCEPDLYRTSDSGENWEATGGTDGSWHLLASAKAKQVHAPDGNVDSPCGDARAIEVESIDVDIAAVLCNDGVVYLTTNAGEGWKKLATSSGAVAMAAIDEDNVVVARKDINGCDGLSVENVVSRSKLGCASRAASTGVAINFGDPSKGMLIADGRTWVTSNAGFEWRRVS